MIIQSIKSIGLLELFNDILSVNKSKEKMSKDKDNSSNEKARLTDKASYLLDQIYIVLEINDISYFDANIIKTIGDVKVLGVSKGISPFSSTYDLRLSHPDLYNYLLESHGILESLGQVDKLTSLKLTPVGTIKLNARVIIHGTGILNVFGGFLEDFLYKYYGSEEVLTEKHLETIHGHIYKNFLDLVMKRSQQDGIKKGLIEDYLIQKKFFSFLSDSNDKNDVSVAKVIYPDGSITFFTKDSNTVYEEVNKFSSSKSKTDDLDVFVCCCTDIIDYLGFKLRNRLDANIVAVEPIDVVYNKERAYSVNNNVNSAFNVRCNQLLQHNKSFKEIIKKDKSIYGLSLPYNIYNMITCGTRIKYLVQVKMTAKDSNVETTLEKDIKNLLVSLSNAFGLN